MRTKRSIKDSLKEYLNWCVGRLLLGGSRDDTVRDMVDAISDEIASGGGGVSQDQLDQTVKDVTKAYGIADQTVLTSAESYTDQKIADVVDGSPEALDTLYELAKALGDDSNFATTVMDQIGQKLPTTTFENFIDNKAWTKDNLTKLSQLINNINSIKAGTRVESMDVNLASISSYLEYDLFDNNTTGTKPPGLTTGFLLTFSWDNGGWGAQIATSDGNVDGAIFLRTIKASESDKIWGPWVSLYNTANFNPDSKLNYNGFDGDLNTISTSGLYRLVSGCTNTPNSGSSQGCHIIHTNWDTNAVHQLYFEYYGSMFYRYKHGVEWSDWKRVWTEFEFNPDNYLPLSGGSITGSLGVSGYLTAGSLKINETGSVYPQILFTGNNGNSSLLFVNAILKELVFRPADGVANDGIVYHSKNLTKLSQLTNDVVPSWALATTNHYLPYDDTHNTNYAPYNSNISKGLTTVHLKTTGIDGLADGGNYHSSIYITPWMDASGGHAHNIAFTDNGNMWMRHGTTSWSEWVKVYHSGNLGNATTSQAGLMSAADKTKLDGLSGGMSRGESPVYYFPGDPSKLAITTPKADIPNILGPASEFMGAFNNGRVFISKTVTFSEVQVPSDITYSLLKSIDPDNPTIFQIIMSTVVWGHYIEVTIDFENNEYQAIAGTINGSISVNTTGTSN